MSRDARINRIFEAHDKDAEDKYVFPLRRGVERSLLDFYGDTPDNRKALGTMSLPEQITRLYETGVAVGQRMGPAETDVVMAKKAYEAELKTAYQRGYDKWKSEHPGDAPPAGAGRTNTVSDAELLSDPETPVQTLIEIRSRQRAAGG